MSDSEKEKTKNEMQDALKDTVNKIKMTYKDMQNGYAQRATALSAKLDEFIRLWDTNPQMYIKNKLIELAQQIQIDIEKKDFSDSTIKIRTIQNFYK